jgi:hypothetical protein
MRLESSLDPPEPSQFNSTKRLGEGSAVGRETKRLCPQPSELPPGSAALQLSNGHNWWGGFGIASNPEFGNAVPQYGIDPETEWENTVPPDIFGLDSTPNPQTAGFGPFLFNTVPTQMWGMDIQSNPGADSLYHQPENQESMNAFDSQYSFDASKPIPPSLELSHDFDFSYSGSSLESWILPDSSCSPFTPFIDGTSTRIDVTTGLEKDSGHQPLGSFVSYEPDTIEMAPNGEGTLVTNLEEPESMGNGDTSESFSAVMGYNKDLPGKPRRKHVLILVF